LPAHRTIVAWKTVSAAIHSEARRAESFSRCSASVIVPASGRQFRGPGGRFPRAEGFQPQAQLHEVAERVLIEVEHQVDRRGHHGLGPPDHVGAGAAPDLDQSHQ
jgi:hypothetical protein